MSDEQQTGSLRPEPEGDRDEFESLYRSPETVQDVRKVPFSGVSSGNRQLLFLLLGPVCLLCLGITVLIAVFLVSEPKSAERAGLGSLVALLGLPSFGILGCWILIRLRRGRVGALGYLLLLPPLVLLFIETEVRTGRQASWVIGTLLGSVALVVFRSTQPKARVTSWAYGSIFLAFGVFAFLPSVRHQQLFEAVRSGDAERVQVLVERGFALNERDPAGRTPLILAAELGNRKVVAALLTGKGPLNVRDHQGRSALSLAVERRDPEMIRLLVGAGAAVLTSRKAREPGPMATAIREKDTEMTLLLLEELRERRRAQNP